jgi:hypothetical protein
MRWKIHPRQCEALSQFHAICGFEPDGDGVARFLGYPVAELSAGHDAHIEREGGSEWRVENMVFAFSELPGTV